MEIRQFEDPNLAQFSYAILSGNEIALVDPLRDPGPYYEFAAEKQAKIVAVIETHPHADFISGHLEIHNDTGAPVYVHSRLGALYPHRPFDEGSVIKIGNITLHSLETPGHSPDSISILLKDETGKKTAVFTGDSLFIGDCGRPDLRENAGNTTAARTELARMMYQTLHRVFLALPDDVIVYPAHGSGSLCGKSLSSDTSATIGHEKRSNWSLQPMTENAFIQTLLEGQPFIPAYFGHSVELNRKGADALEKSITSVPAGTVENGHIPEGVLIIDGRSPADYHKSHLEGSINIPEGKAFETWLGTIVPPGKEFFLVHNQSSVLHTLVKRAAGIGYEKYIRGAFILEEGTLTDEPVPLNMLKKTPEAFTIIDIRSEAEARNKKFPGSIHIPLHLLAQEVSGIPADKPIIVHCAGGYRSAVGSSLLKHLLDHNIPVYDLGEAIKNF